MVQAANASACLSPQPSDHKFHKKGMIFCHGRLATVIIFGQYFENILQACHCDKREQAAMNHQDYSATTRWENSIWPDLYCQKPCLTFFSIAQELENCPKFDFFTWVRYVVCWFLVIVYVRVCEWLSLEGMDETNTFELLPDHCPPIFSQQRNGTFPSR